MRPASPAQGPYTGTYKPTAFVQLGIFAMRGRVAIVRTKP